MVAAKYMQAALDLAPEHDEFRVNAAAIYSRLGWLDLAFHTARSLPEHLSDWWARARRTALDDYRQRRSSTLKFLRQRRGGATYGRDERWRLSQDLFALGRISTARSICEQLVCEGPRSYPAFYFLAQIIARQSGPDAAVAFLQSVETLADDLPDYPIRIARLLHEAGRYQEALDKLSHPSIANLDSEEVRWARFVALFLLGSRERLIGYCRQWLLEAPDSLAPAGYLAAMRSEQNESGGEGALPATLLKPHIVQFWDTQTVPSDVAEVMDSWRRMHPHAGYTVFDERAAQDFLDQHYGSEVVETFKLCHHAAMKADYFRIAFLYQAGGVYVDADELCLQPINDILAAAEHVEIIATLSGDVPGYLHNWFLGARPHSPVLGFALEDATVGVRRALQAGRKPDIWLVTGPGLITRAVGRYLARQDEHWNENNAVLMPLQQYRNLARTESGLSYKTKASANWQLA